MTLKLRLKGSYNLLRIDLNGITRCTSCLRFIHRHTRAIGLLLEQAVAAGEVRGDVSPEDLLRAKGAYQNCIVKRRLQALVDQTWTWNFPKALSKRSLLSAKRHHSARFLCS